MDLTALITKGGELGFIVVLLLIAVRYLLKRLEQNEARAARLISEHRQEAIAREEANRTECLAREHDLANRLRTIEDSQTAAL